MTIALCNWTNDDLQGFMVSVDIDFRCTYRSLCDPCVHIPQGILSFFFKPPYFYLFVRSRGNIGKMQLGDPSEKTDYLSSSKRAFVDHRVTRPQREKRNANESTGFEGPNAKSKIVTEVPKNCQTQDVRRQQEVVCRDILLHRAKEASSKRTTASQVDCSIMGARFDGVSETAASLARGRLSQPGGERQGPSFSSEFAPPTNPILHTGLSHLPSVFEHPAAIQKLGGHTVKRRSQNAAERERQVRAFEASTMHGSAFHGGVHL